MTQFGVLPTGPLTKRLLALNGRRRSPPRPPEKTEIPQVFRFKHIMAALAQLAEQRGETLDALLGRSRRKPIADARQEAYYVLAEHYKLSHPRIGQIFGRNHSTVTYGYWAHVDRSGLAPTDGCAAFWRKKVAARARTEAIRKARKAGKSVDCCEQRGEPCGSQPQPFDEPANNRTMPACQ